MVHLPVLFAALAWLAAPVASDQAVERQHVLSIAAQDIDGGILSEISGSPPRTGARCVGC